jgi:hypothetical protein
MSFIEWKSNAQPRASSKPKLSITLQDLAALIVSGFRVKSTTGRRVRLANKTLKKAMAYAS